MTTEPPAMTPPTPDVDELVARLRVVTASSDFERGDGLVIVPRKTLVRLLDAVSPPPTPEDPDLLLARKVVAIVAGNAARHHLHPDPKAYESGACDHGTSVQAVLAVIKAERGE